MSSRASPSGWRGAGWFSPWLRDCSKEAGESMSVRNRPIRAAARSLPRDQALSSRHAASLERQGLRSPGWFARWPVIGLLLFLAGGLAFGAIAYNVQSGGPLVQLDRSLYRDMYAQASSAP